MNEWIRGSLLLIVLVIAVITDLRTMKIPNWLTLPFIAVSVIFAIIAKDTQWVTTIIVVVFLFFMSVMDAIGIGDAKLLIGVTILCGWNVSLIGLIIGLFLFVFLSFTQNPRKVLSATKTALKAFFCGNFAFLKNLNIEERKPFAPTLAIGIAAMYLMIIIFPLWR